MPSLFQRLGRRKSRNKRTESLSSVVSAEASLKRENENARLSGSRSLPHHDDEVVNPRRLGRRWRPRRSVFAGLENDKTRITGETQEHLNDDSTSPSTPPSTTYSQTPPLTTISTPARSVRPRFGTADESSTTDTDGSPYDDPVVRLAFEASDPFDPEHRNRIAREAAELDKQGNVFFEQGQYNRAFSLYRRALTLKRQSLHVSVEEEVYDEYDALDEEELDSKQTKASILASVATSINNMTYLKQRAGQASSDETMAAYLKSLQIKREILGPDHLSVGKTLNNIGSVFYLQQDYESALKAYQDAYGIMEQNLGADHLDVGTVASNIGDVYYMMDQQAQALQHYRKSLDVRWRVLGQYDPKVIRLMEQIAALETGEQPMKGNGELSESEQEDFEIEDRKKYADFQKEVKILQNELEEDMKFFEMLERELVADVLKHNNRIVWNNHDDESEASDDDEGNQIRELVPERLEESGNDSAVQAPAIEGEVSPVPVPKDAPEDDPAIEAQESALVKDIPEDEPVMDVQVSPDVDSKEAQVEEHAIGAQATLVVRATVHEDIVASTAPQSQETVDSVAAAQTVRAGTPPPMEEPVSDVQSTSPSSVSVHEEPERDDRETESPAESVSSAQVISPRKQVVTEASPPPSLLKNPRTRSMSESEGRNVLSSVQERLEKIRAEREKLIAAHESHRSSEDIAERLAKLRAERAALKAAKEKKAAECAERLARLREERAARMATQAAKAAEDAERLARLRKARAARLAAQEVQSANELETTQKGPATEKTPPREFRRRHYMEPTTSSALKKAATPEDRRQRRNSTDEYRSPETRQGSNTCMTHLRRNSSGAMEDLKPATHSQRPITTAMDKHSFA